MNKQSLWRRLKRAKGTVVEGHRRVGTAQQKGANSPRRKGGTALRKARDFIQQGKTAKGLQALNAAAGGNVSAIKKLKISAIVADVAFKQGDFSKAAAEYKAAGDNAPNHPRAWLRTSLGQVRAHLKDADLTSAAIVASKAWDRGLALHEEQERKIAIDQARSAGQKIHIGKRPHRGSVVASRLGWLFLNEGEIDAANEYFAKALQVNPQGASRARHGLAAIALARGNPTEAEKRARECLLLGRFQRKTIASWPILIAARQQQNIRGIDADFLAAVDSQREPSVQARTILVIAKSLRDHGDPSWIPIADNWLAGKGNKSPIEATELRKLKMASLRGEARDLPAQISVSGALIKKPALLSFREYLAAAKENVRARLWAGKQVNLLQMVQVAADFYGAPVGIQFMHGLARACMTANREDLARTLLAQVINVGPIGSSDWSKAVYALARMEMGLSRPQDAVAALDLLLSSPDLDVRFRCKARVEWMRALIKTGNTERLSSAVGELVNACAAIEDADLIMDVARQLNRVAPEQSSTALAIFKRGQTLAYAAFDGEQHPSRAASMLYLLARHEADFRLGWNTVATWKRLTKDQREWLWTLKSDYWDYLALVLKSWYHGGQPADAEEFAGPFLADPGTSAEGIAILASCLGECRVASNLINEALPLFQRAITSAPTHIACAPAYYWLSVKSYHLQNFPESKRLAEGLLHALGNHTSYLWNVILERKALCIRANFDLTAIPEQIVRHTPQSLAQAKNDVLADLTRLAQ